MKAADPGVQVDSIGVGENQDKANLLTDSRTPDMVLPRLRNFRAFSVI